MILTINTKDQIKKLNDSFHHVTRSLGKNNSKGTLLYDYQVDFAYLLDSIEHGPVFQIPFLINKAEQHIRNISTQINQSKQG